MKQKNDYSVVVFLSTGEVKKWTYVHKLSGFVQFLDNKHSEWIYMNVYNRRNRKYLKRFYKGNSAPDFL
ncbi:hypothetical protein SAMN05216283_102310 [Sunxiuqinia elliptica]|uniref:Uncharacterized protein n=1 Tax=Sunxiuqinia elliptica TaxID=655355 RepID=A0A1I2F116_9BACT|nr:hypothetical protein SAMN05216283_102310 [Sunxiuqinia elliptica]